MQGFARNKTLEPTFGLNPMYDGIAQVGARDVVEKGKEEIDINEELTTFLQEIISNKKSLRDTPPSVYDNRYTVDPFYVKGEKTLLELSEEAKPDCAWAYEALKKIKENQDIQEYQQKKKGLEGPAL